MSEDSRQSDHDGGGIAKSSMGLFAKLPLHLMIRIGRFLREDGSLDHVTKLSKSLRRLYLPHLVHTIDHRGPPFLLTRRLKAFADERGRLITGQDHMHGAVRSLTISVIPYDEHESPNSPGGWDDLHDMIHDDGDALPKLIAECISYTTTLQALSLNLRGLSDIQTQRLISLQILGNLRVKSLRIRLVRSSTDYQRSSEFCPWRMFYQCAPDSLQSLQINFGFETLALLLDNQNLLRSLSIVLDDWTTKLLPKSVRICDFSLMIKLVCRRFPSLEALVLQDYTITKRWKLPLSTQCKYIIKELQLNQRLKHLALFQQHLDGGPNLFPATSLHDHDRYDCLQETVRHIVSEVPSIQSVSIMDKELCFKAHREAKETRVSSLNMRGSRREFPAVLF